MIEIFTTNIPNQNLGNEIIKILKRSFFDLKIDFDIEAPIGNYPCDHSILRVEGKSIDPQGIVSTLNDIGYKCHILEDKICH
ncbi:hypothetical protein LZ575_20020 [Antarcticibacterium sp. 1MA-6-2]|uniref:hypothetical protein n=1 Tax=Antarcticibacterium sp. 1MA-6-2 TaxID=2908210 RepID=UPI001F3DCDDA|nr:hypothetical protein [Antarcticibacterium sp. 1MA-6-2]UJH90948.1 hypothetical protein LZ575_20020 [Antarcticibacterium sp. 1MA-6-2]